MRRLRSDEGFSLSELLVVIGLMGIILAAAYAVMNLVTVGSNQSNREAWISQEIGQPMLSIERQLTQQAPPLKEVSAYVCYIRTDQDRDNTYELHRYEATSDGRLIEQYAETNSATPVLKTRTWSTHNRNVSTGTPLFRYIDVDGNDISSKGSVYITQYAVSVDLTIVTEYDGKQLSDSRRVFFRNR